MRLHDLQPAPGSRKAPKRVGRGTGSGHGKTATRGHKGQWARSGPGVRPGFEGGQMPLQRRLPKRGFSNAPFKKEYEVVNLGDLNRFEAGTTVTLEMLRSVRLIQSRHSVKVLGDGDLEKALVVHAHAFSKPALEKILAVGGVVHVLGDDEVTHTAEGVN